MSAFVPRAGDWALVTGAGSGIGRFLCRYFADAGMNIVATDIDGDAAGGTVGECNAKVERRAEQVDVTNRDALLGLARRLDTDGIVPSVLWANAGVGSAAATVTAKPAAVEWLYAVNVLGPIWTGQAFLPRMIEAGGRRHVGITASSASVTPIDGPFTLYATTKQATAAVGEAWVAELAQHDIGVTILCPGILDTAIWNSARSRPARFGGARDAPHEAGQHWREQPDPDILGPAIDRSLARGGGYCIVPTEDATLPAMRSRHDAQMHGLYQPKNGSNA